MTLSPKNANEQTNRRQKSLLLWAVKDANAWVNNERVASSYSVAYGWLFFQNLCALYPNLKRVACATEKGATEKGATEKGATG